MMSIFQIHKRPKYIFPICSILFTHLLYSPCYFMAGSTSLGLDSSLTSQLINYLHSTNNGSRVIIFILVTLTFPLLIKITTINRALINDVLVRDSINITYEYIWTEMVHMLHCAELLHNNLPAWTGGDQWCAEWCESSCQRVSGCNVWNDARAAVSEWVVVMCGMMREQQSASEWL